MVGKIARGMSVWLAMDAGRKERCSIENNEVGGRGSRPLVCSRFSGEYVDPFLRWLE